MNGNIHGLSWLPNCPEKFVIWGQEINLCEMRAKGAASPSDNEPDKGTTMAFLASECRYQYVRCLQPSYHKDNAIIAVGLADGKVAICNFQDVIDSSWEFTPRQQRSCLCLAWNELEPNLLAIGHDRNRSDSCITIWDIERGLPKESGNFFGNSESAHSMCWDKQHRVLITGMSQKQIKLFDLRQSNASCQSILTKTVHGLGVATNGNYLCSYVDSVIMLWDLRAIDRPLRQIQSDKNHSLLSWCPTRPSLLASLQRDSPFINLYEIRSVDVENSREVYHIKKQLQPYQNKQQAAHKSNALSGLSWHPSDYERALVLSESGSILDYKLPAVTLAVFNKRNTLPQLVQSPSTAVVTNTSPAHTSKITNVRDTSGKHEDAHATDFIEETRRRALNDYGLKTDMSRLSELQVSAYLKRVWLSLAQLYRDGERLTGLKSILGIGLGHTSEALMSTSRVESQVLQWPNFINNSSDLIGYRSEQRELVLKLCGWSLEQDLERFITTLCEQKEFSRAAMICVFHLKILRACDILSKAAQLSADPSMFTIAAIALSSFNAAHCSSTWRQQRTSANMQIQNPHLRTIFAFLTSDFENYETVLNEQQLSLSDRMAFACKYLSENKLSDFVKQQIQKSIEHGDLNGLLLTGESLDGINILQAYMDVTPDVQTVALIAINYFHRDHFQDSRIQYWVASYLDLLNCWGLWEKRADLEIKIQNISGAPRASRSVFLSCNFCGKSVSNAVQEDARMRNATSNINKLSSCPSCRKPLPRCSLCRLHMGTTVSSATAGDVAQESLGWQTKPFSKWFAWCQTCRHGGHTEHIMEWFKQNSECPVISCSCKCFDLDALKPRPSHELA